MVTWSPAPQAWVFPPAGAINPAANVSAAFGPVRQGDTIELLWAPADVKPRILFAYWVGAG